VPRSKSHENKSHAARSMRPAQQGARNEKRAARQREAWRTLGHRGRKPAGWRCDEVIEKGTAAAERVGAASDVDQLGQHRTACSIFVIAKVMSGGAADCDSYALQNGFI